MNSNYILPFSAPVPESCNCSVVRAFDYCIPKYESQLHVGSQFFFIYMYMCMH